MLHYLKGKKSDSLKIVQPDKHIHDVHQLIDTQTNPLTGSQSPKRVVDLCCNQGRAVEVQYLYVTTRRALK